MAHLPDFSSPHAPSGVCLIAALKMDEVALRVRAKLLQSCLTLWDPMGFSTPDFPVLHRLLAFAQAQVRCVDDAIPPSHPVASFSGVVFVCICGCSMS